MVTFAGRHFARALQPGEQAGALVDVKIPWTVDLPSPHGNAVLSEHFSLEQCELLCETIELARIYKRRERCRLRDLFGNTWFAEIYPGRNYTGGHLQWFHPSKPLREEPGHGAAAVLTA